MDNETTGNNIQINIKEQIKKQSQAQDDDTAKKKLMNQRGLSLRNNISGGSTGIDTGIDSSKDELISSLKDDGGASAGQTTKAKIDQQDHELLFDDEDDPQTGKPTTTRSDKE